MRLRAGRKSTRMIPGWRVGVTVMAQMTRATFAGFIAQGSSGHGPSVHNVGLHPPANVVQDVVTVQRFRCTANRRFALHRVNARATHLHGAPPDESRITYHATPCLRVYPYALTVSGTTPAGSSTTSSCGAGSSFGNTGRYFAATMKMTMPMLKSARLRTISIQEGK